eukprot:gene17573-23141_t
MGRYVSSKYITPTLENTFSDRIVDWDSLERELIMAINNGNEAFVISDNIKDEIETEKRIQNEYVTKIKAKSKLQSLQNRNGQAVMLGKWRKEPFPARVYDKLDSYAVCKGLSEKDSTATLKQLNTKMNGFLGPAYNYDDHSLTEAWMMSFKDGKFNASPEDVIRTQIESLLEILTNQVQDRVCNELGVLDEPPTGLGADLKEAPVWGIDCYTRRMIELLISDSSKSSNDHIIPFIERKLLPSINASSPNKAHSMMAAVESILQSNDSSEVDKEFSNIIANAINEFGASSDLFRIHPKGTGVICTNINGIQPHQVIAEYLGELYPPYRWCEKLDVVEQAQKKYGLKPTLPDFYNILLERPRQDPNGYGLLYVDASQRANLGSSCSHSCNANCTSAVVAKNGKLVIVLTTNRFVYFGEELTMDYYSITTSDVEWRAAICLCGMSSCRGSFLHYATQDDLQQVLNQSCGPLWRYASLLRACSNRPLHQTEKSVLSRHGFKSSVFDEQPIDWLVKYTADNLKFIEFERTALPCTLMRSKQGESSKYTYTLADLDARSVMEQRIQSMVCCISMVNRVLKHQSINENITTPLRLPHVSETSSLIWNMLKSIPGLLTDYLITPREMKGKLSSESKSEYDTIQSNMITDPPSILRIKLTIDNISVALETCPKNLTETRSICLKVKSYIKEIEEFSTSTARLQLLNDLLILWAYTTNFSIPQEYNIVTSEEVTVVAGELGNNIVRSKIFQNEIIPRKSRSNANINTDDMLIEVNYSENCDINDNLQTDDSMNISDNSISHDVFDTKSIELDKVNEVEAIDRIDQVEVNMITTLNEDGSTDINSVSTSEENVISSDILTNSKKYKYFLSPIEPVFSGSKTYDKMFVFSQLMGWFNAGTDEKIDAPDLFGCVELPKPFQCFGISDSKYGQEQRDKLVSYLRDEKAQSLPWPIEVRKCFSKGLKSSFYLYGSPTLDVALGKIDTVIKILEEIGVTIEKKSNKQHEADDNTQYDSNLPPEAPTEWVQCDGCRKWRRVAWHIDIETLPEYWTCSMNTWDENPSCEVPQDIYNPDKENTIDYAGELAVDVNEASNNLVVGERRDVYCNHNNIYYEAEIIELKYTNASKKFGKAKFHFIGWNKKFDEWLNIGSDRIKPHNLFTSTEAKTLRDQEKWQGFEKIETKPKTKSKSKSISRKSFTELGSNISYDKVRSDSTSSKRRRVTNDKDNEIITSIDLSKYDQSSLDWNFLSSDTKGSLSSPDSKIQ